MTSATLTASRTWTLPLANSVNAGYEIIIADLFGGVSSTNTLVIARAGSDTVNGNTSATIGASYAMRRLISDGVSKWTFDAGVMRISDYIGTTLTANKVVVTDANSKLAPSSVSTTTLGYVDFTSSGQTQLDLKQDKSIAAYSLMANNTNAAANSTAFTFKAPAQQTYSGTITWTGTSAPSGATNHSYNWVQIGNMVTLTINLVYATVGSGLTAVTMSLPTDCPNPVYPTGVTGALANLYIASGKLSISTTNAINSVTYSSLRRNTADTVFELYILQGAGGHRVAQVTVQYYTS